MSSGGLASEGCGTIGASIASSRRSTISLTSMYSLLEATMLRTVATSWTGARLGVEPTKGKLMPKTPILKLIPSGKKLSEVTYNVESLVACNS